LFAVGVLPLLSIQLVVNDVLSNTSPAPGGLDIRLSAVAPARVVGAIASLHATTYTWAFWMPGKIQAILIPASPAAWQWPLGLTAAAALAVFFAAKRYRARGQPPERDARTLALGLFVAVPALLCIVTLWGSFNYVTHLSFYAPLVPLSVFVAFSAAGMAGRAPSRRAAVLVRSTAAFYAAAYTGMVLVYLALSLTAGRLGDTQRSRIQGAEISRWPSTAVAQELSPARRAVLRRLSERPQALLLTSRPALFEWDPIVDRSKLLVMSCERLAADRISGPASLFVLTFDLGARTSCGRTRATRSGAARCAPTATATEPAVGRAVPGEGLKLLESHVEPGRQVSLEP
jgi:hypothetical protein